MAELLTMDLGQAAYLPTLELQLNLVDQACSSREELAYLLLVEHSPPVITLGRGGRADHVLAGPRQLAEEGVELHRATRGGDVTYHGPGQLVAYPVIRLDLHGRDVKGYLRQLEAALIATLGDFGIAARQCQGLTGVWAGQEKIAAIGVAIRRWVSYHGLALNVCPNMAHFELIVPCGIADKAVTSMTRVLGRPVEVAEVKPALAERLAETLGFDGVRRSRPTKAVGL